MKFRPSSSHDREELKVRAKRRSIACRRVDAIGIVVPRQRISPWHHTIERGKHVFIEADYHDTRGSGRPLDLAQKKGVLIQIRHIGSSIGRSGALPHVKDRIHRQRRLARLPARVIDVAVLSTW
jgi:hypothetical protein